MQLLWKGNYYKAGLREGHCLQVVVVVVRAETSEAATAVNVVVVVRTSKVEGTLNNNNNNNNNTNKIRCWYCAKREYNIILITSFTIWYKQSSNRAIFTREGSISPTLMGYKPIQSGDSYDVIRGGHRQFWFVRR